MPSFLFLELTGLAKSGFNKVSEVIKDFGGLKNIVLVYNFIKE